MTIDEFMRDIAPKMRAGWVAMDEQQKLCYNTYEPKLLQALCPNGRLCKCWNTMGEILPFDIDPIDDWTQSLRKVGK